MKKITGPQADEHYRFVVPDTGEIVQRTPEFARMSLRPGIGAGWFDRFSSDVFPGDRVVSRGREAKPPRYYDKLLSRTDPDLSDEVQYQRHLARLSRGAFSEESDERRAVREKVARAATSRFSRSI